jgi:hypothetical protein
VSRPDGIRSKTFPVLASLPTGGVSEKNAGQFLFCMLEAQFVRAGSHDHHDVGARLQLRTVQTKKLANQTLRPIALDSTPDLAARRDAEAGLARRAGTLEHQEVLARLAASSALDPKEVPARTDAARPCQPKIRATSARAWAESLRSGACDPSRGAA